MNEDKLDFAGLVLVFGLFIFTLVLMPFSKLSHKQYRVKKEWE